MSNIITRSQLDMALANPEAARLELLKANAEEHIRDFVPIVWPVLEPGRDFITGWAIDAIFEHLMAFHNKDLMRLLINVPPGFMKPVLETEYVQTNTGPKQLKDIKIGDKVLTHRNRFRSVIGVHKQGELDLLQVKTDTGREVSTAPDHPILTQRGWVQAKDLVVGDRTASPLQGPSAISDELTEDEARLLGYLIGDGCTSQFDVTYCSADDEMLEDVKNICEKLGFRTFVKTIRGNSTTLGLRTGSSNIYDWLEKFDLRGKTSYTKTVPTQITRSSNKIIENFVSTYWSCDGHISGAHVYSCSVSEKLSRGIMHCLLRLGLDARLRLKERNLKTKRQGNTYKYTEVWICSSDIGRMAQWGHLVERKRSAAEARKDFRFTPEYAENIIVSVEPNGTGNCRCLSVEDDSSFTANDIVVHNSLACGVMYPAWKWGPGGEPWHRFVSGSYSKDITLRDNRKSRLIMDSPQYQAMWGDKFSLDTDQGEKQRYENDKRGFRLALSVGGATTGERGDTVILDDPHNVKTAESDNDLNDKLHYFNEVLPTRVNDMMLSQFLIIMQRVHERDISGHIIANNLDFEYTHLEIPMEFEVHRRCKTFLLNQDIDWDAPFWEDPREEEDELAFPERFPRIGVDRLKAQFRSDGGDYAVAGQLQQRPAPRGGGLILTDKIQFINRGNLPKMVKRVRGWDLAGTDKKKSPWTVGMLVGEDAEGFVYIMHEFRIKDEVSIVKRKILGTDDYRGQISRDDINVFQEFPQDPGQAGKAQKVDWSKHPELKKREFRFTRESGSKETRMKPFASQVEAGMVFIVDEPWARPCLGELEVFPAGALKDRADAISNAYTRMNLMVRNSMVSAAGVMLID